MKETKKQKKIKAGDIIRYQKKNFEVVKYDGIFAKDHGKLKAIEMVSMFESPTDFFLSDLSPKERGKISILNN